MFCLCNKALSSGFSIMDGWMKVYYYAKYSSSSNNNNSGGVGDNAAQISLCCLVDTKLI